MKNSKLLLVMLLVGIATYALLSNVDISEADLYEYSGKCGDDVSYDFDVSSGLLSITGSGPMYNYRENGNIAPWRSYSDLVKKVDIGESVTTVGEYAFYSCSSITSVSIADTVLRIESHAFQLCTSLTSVFIPNSVGRIGDFSFYNCTSLKSISIPESVWDLSSAFRNCTSLISIDVDENNKDYCSIDGVLFNKKKTILMEYPAGKPDLSYTIPDTVTTIRYYAFTNCNFFTSVTMPDSVNSLDNGAFRGCASLKTINISASVKSLPSYIFDGCTSLASITLPDSVTSIGRFGFYHCTSLTSVTLSDSLQSIGEGSFRDCTSLTSIIIPDSVTFIGSDAFQECKSLKSIIIGNSITSIQGRTFSTCISLTSVTLPDSVTSIGDYTFESCTALTSVTLSNSLTVIGKYAFWKCTSLQSISIPDSVTDIDRFAFYTCTALTSVTIGKSVTSIGYGAFYNCDSLVSFDVSGDNTTYCSEDGVLFNKDMTTLIQCPMCKTGNYVVPDTVTTIELSAFRNCTMLTSLTIPGSVTSIGEGAFHNCNGLTELTVPANLDCVAYTAAPVFNGCVNIQKVTFTGSDNWYSYGSFYAHTPWQLSRSVLTSVIISEGVLSVDGSAFAGCTALSSVVIPDSVVTLGEGAFNGCTGLTELTVPANLDCVVSTKNSVFEGCVNVQEITFTGSGTWCSYGMSYLHTPWQLSRSALTSVIISDGVLTIGDLAFAGCTTLSSVTIPGSVISFGESSFRNCVGLTELTVPANLNCVGSNENPVFEGCVNITKMNFTGTGEWYAYDISVTGYSGSRHTNDVQLLSVTSGSERCYYGFTPWQLSRSNLSSVIIAEGVETIGDSAFKDCSKLTFVVVPDSVTTLGNQVFSGCTSLSTMIIDGDNSNYSISHGVLFNADKTTLIEYLSGNTYRTYVIPFTVKNIGDYAFAECTSLTSLTIPSSVTFIGTSAFNGDFYDDDGVTKLAPIASNLAGHTFLKIDDKWVKQVASPTSSGPEGIWIICIILEIFVVGITPAILSARRYNA